MRPHARPYTFSERHPAIVATVAGILGGTIAGLAMVGLVYLLKLYGGLL